MLSMGRNGSRAMADRLVFTALNRKKRGANKSLFWKHFAKSFNFKPSVALSRSQGTRCITSSPVKSGKNERSNLPKQHRCSNSLKHVWCRRNAATQTLNKHCCLFKEKKKADNCSHVELTYRSPPLKEYLTQIVHKLPDGNLHSPWWKFTHFHRNDRANLNRAIAFASKWGKGVCFYLRISFEWYSS